MNRWLKELKFYLTDNFRNDAKKSMSLVEAADYVLTLREGYTLFDGFKEGLDSFYSMPEINICKTDKEE